MRRGGDKPSEVREQVADPDSDENSLEPPAKQRKVTSPGGAAPSLRERLAARGAEPPPDTARGSPEALRGKAPATKTSGQQKLLFRAPAPADPESADPESVEPKSRKSTKSVATPCRRNDVSTPKSDCKSDLSASADSTPKAAASLAEVANDSPALRRPDSDLSVASEPQDAALQRRREEASQEIARILPLKHKRFCSEVLRAKGILGLTVEAHEISLVQQAFRSLMRKLHPDRIGQCPRAAEAMEMLQEAKQQCERAFSQLRPPAQPKHLSFKVLCATPGRRRIRLDWKAPEVTQTCPVRRYLVAALDPAYGQALTITVLEPEYNEKLKRFTTIEELATYDLAEEELTKMPRFFQQANAVVRVAAENELGQSNWCSLQLPLIGLTALAPAVPSIPTAPAPQAAASKPSKKAAAAGPSISSKECRDFETMAHSLRESGNELCSWLRKQSKALLSGWLRSQGWPTTGSKDELVDRVAFAVGAVSKRA